MDRVDTPEKSGWMLFDGLTLLKSAATYFRKGIIEPVNGFAAAAAAATVTTTTDVVVAQLLSHFSHFAIQSYAYVYRCICECI